MALCDRGEAFEDFDRGEAGEPAVGDEPVLISSTLSFHET